MSTGYIENAYQKNGTSMKYPNYWKEHYVVESNADEIERNIKSTTFTSGGKKDFELIYFEKGIGAPNILISQGSGGHAYVFAELGYKMYLRGYNVFVMPKHGGYTITELMARHKDALNHISDNFSKKIGVFSEGLGGFVVFYLALAHGPMKSIVCQNSPGILTENEFHKAVFQGKGGAAERRKKLLPLLKILVKLLPTIRLPISTYLNFEELIDMKEKSRKIELSLVEEGYLNDSDFDTSYPLSAIMSLVLTPPPNPLSVLDTPTMFLVPTRGWADPSYVRDLYYRLPDIKKKFVEVDGSVFWMVSHPEEAAEIICDWFKETL